MAATPNPQENMIKYGGWISLLLSILALLGYLALGFSSESGGDSFKKLFAVEENIKRQMKENTFESVKSLQNATPAPPTIVVANYVEKVKSNWTKPEFEVTQKYYQAYPVLGVTFEECNEDEIRQAKTAIKGKVLYLSPEEYEAYQGHKIKIIRGEEIAQEKATPPRIVSVLQETMEVIRISWEDSDPEMMSKTGLEEYQLYRILEDSEEAIRLTPEGHTDQSFNDTAFDPRTKYTYYVVTKVQKVTEKIPPYPKESTPSERVSIETQPDVVIIFTSIIGSGNATQAQVDVYKYTQGDWQRKGFGCKKGEKIGKVAKNHTLTNKQKSDVDFTTPYEVLSYYDGEERIVERDGKTEKIPNQAQLNVIDTYKGKNDRLPPLWKYNPLVDKNPYKK